MRYDFNKGLVNNQVMYGHAKAMAYLRSINPEFRYESGDAYRYSIIIGGIELYWDKLSESTKRFVMVHGMWINESFIKKNTTQLEFTEAEYSAWMEDLEDVLKMIRSDIEGPIQEFAFLR